MHLDTATKNELAIRQGKELKTLAYDLHELTKEIQSGDTTHIQSILLAQSITLASIFENVLEMSIQAPTAHSRISLMHLALKSQEQSRKTLTSLNAMHHPRANTLIQNNHAYNQQINNGDS
mgnify:FL=1